MRGKISGQLRVYRSRAGSQKIFPSPRFSSYKCSNGTQKIRDNKLNESGGSEDFREAKQVEAPGTIGAAGKRRWLYPDRRTGPRGNRRKLTAICLILFYFVAPWINIGDRPLLRLDVQGQFASIFGFILKMNEYNLVFFFVASLGLLLFLVTSIRGRIWCGYACPQTVFVEWVIRPIEEWIEGPALKRRKRDSEPMDFQLFIRKAFKQVIFFAVGCLVANSFLGFFVDPRLIIHWIASPPTQHPTAFAFVLFLSGAMYFDLGWFREQFCSFLCPYARFQSVLLDNSSPTVAYDAKRGDPRGKKAGSGDCIDCGLCVRVCPTGIDIRDGLQLECIQCERCVDACDSIMENLKRPKGLILIASQADLAGAVTIPFYRRPRVLLYSFLIIFLTATGAFKMLSRETVAMTFLRQPGSAFARMDDGRISNIFSLRAVNHANKAESINLTIVNNLPGIQIICPGCTDLVEPLGDRVSPVIVIFSDSYRANSVAVKAANSETVYDLPLIRP
jgi:cytochrome c oxidase accessory protein FixG